MKQFGILGFGNLPQSLFDGLALKGAILPSEMMVYDKSESARAMAKSLGCAVAESMRELLFSCETFIAAVKPSVFRTLSQEIKEADKSFTRTVSVMAGMKAQEIAEVTKTPVLRVIPTLAAKLGQDVIGVFGDDFEDVKSMLRKIGTVLEVSEEELTAEMIAASCGLGFAARVLSHYQTAVEALGFSPEQAQYITSAVFANAAALPPFGNLADKVATKGGVTEKGLADMEKNGLGKLFCSAFETVFH